MNNLKSLLIATILFTTLALATALISCNEKEVAIGGIYKFGKDVEKGPVGSVMIYPLEGNAALFSLELSRGAPSYNSGRLEGRMTIKDNLGTYEEINEYNNCVLKFKFASRQLEITIEDGHSDCGFGANVNADNIYKLIDKSIPQYYLSVEGEKIFFKDLITTKTADNSVKSSVQTVEFNGKKIPITIFSSSVVYSDGSSSFADDRGNLDSLMFEYDNKTQIIHLNGNFGEISSPISVSDYNFDGYMDIVVFAGIGDNMFSYALIYKPQTKSYYGVNGIGGGSIVDVETQTIISEWGASGEGGLSKYKWINGELTLIYSESEYYDNPHKIFSIQTLQNGKLVEQIYRTVEIEGGGPFWMAQNLNDSLKGGKCYEDKPENCEKYGRLYTWNEAMKACPKGWHLPSDEEWRTLVDFAGGEKVAGKKLKAKSGWPKDDNGTDEYGFSALPGGNYYMDFAGGGEFGIWWVSMEVSADAEIDDAYTYGMNYSHSINAVHRSSVHRAGSCSVRCVKD